MQSGHVMRALTDAFSETVRRRPFPNVTTVREDGREAFGEEQGQLPPASLPGRYEYLGPIGSGGMGFGLQRPRSRPASLRRHEGAGPGAGQERGARAALRQGGPDHRRARSPQHRPGLRARARSSRKPLLHDEARRWTDAGAVDRGGGPADADRGCLAGDAGDGGEGLRRARLRPQPGCPSLRRQAGEHHGGIVRAGVPDGLGRGLFAQRAAGRFLAAQPRSPRGTIRRRACFGAG